MFPEVETYYTEVDTVFPEGETNITKVEYLIHKVKTNIDEVKCNTGEVKSVSFEVDNDYIGVKFNVFLAKNPLLKPLKSKKATHWPPFSNSPLSTLNSQILHVVPSGVSLIM